MVLNDHDERADLIPVAEGTPDTMASLALVLEAVGIPFHYDRAAGQLRVTVGDAPAARFHLDAYHRENLHWPPTPPPAPALSPQTQPTLPVLALLALFFTQTGSWTPDNLWFARGMLDSAAVFGRNEWWRLLTALTLHADLAHLLGNCLIGGMIIHLLGRMIGYGQCWLLLVITGTLGNLANIGLRGQPHLSVGFSTSVFAAIGLLTGLQLARSARRSPRALLLPLGAGAALLALLGGEGVRTDLGAHLFGFACGLAGGWLGHRSGFVERLRAPAWQAPIFLLALAAPIAAWVWALP
ncbi:rhomboid family intramembrane serine protease [Desulfobulbus elongatus]|uniref:rhomboid family intramembrane serine protease n=1 Tax=Desulfobulbus elongatus TaxID=53332 RepID=UPI000685845E|nr:rhomboid family intramembrane serine protease [Desulfobulbus elongatus]